MQQPGKEVTQPAASEPGPNTPPPAKRNKRTEAEQAAEPSQPTRGKGKAKGKAAKAKPAPQPGSYQQEGLGVAQQRLRLYGAQDRTLELFFKQLEEDMEEMSMERHTPKRSKRTEAEQAAEPTKGKGKAKGKAAKAKPAPQPGRWLDRDCNAALNMQRIGESKWRPLELCYWPEQGALPAKGKEYPALGYKRLRDKPPKAQQQQPAEAQ
ncbi:hypothetical protein HaLaN_15489 [Haematococcus lacustris]|uniref:Uncharacterized protein n=1 Tax=Haematococcus lacustris TaxID=44745 RepID=A0A699ZGU1_HAELA|nr:hypothetical protein HaLaN_15489 [Haematococcus lacustris]